MQTNNKIHLVIIESDLNDAEMMISIIKSAGLAVRASRAESAEELTGQLRARPPDLILCTLGTPELDLESTLDTIRTAGKSVPVVAVAPEGASDIVECMQTGAVDMVRKENREHLKLVVARTFRCRRQWQQLKHAEAALNESEKRNRVLLDSSRDAIAYVHEGMHIYANDSYLNLFGYESEDEMEGLPLMDLVASQDQQRLKTLLREFSDSPQGTRHADIQLRDASDQEFEASLEFSIASIEGEPCTQIVIRDRTDAKELEEQLQRLRQRDVASGLYNRKFLMEQVEQSLQEAAKGEQNSVLIQIDVTNIAEIRDLVGITATDVVVIDAAQILGSACKDGETLARFSETTFSLLSGQWEHEQLMARLESLHGALDGHICDVEGRSATLKVRIGAVQIDENAADSNELLQRIDRTLEDAGRRDGPGYAVYVPKAGEMSQRQVDQIWHQRLHLALREDRLRMVFQPIVSLHGDEGERYEVYLRLVDEDGKELSPSEFLPSAERTGVASALDRWLIRAAIARLAQERSTGRDTMFFVKLTAGSLQDHELVAWVGDELRESRVPGGSLVFEVKEAAVVSHLKPAMHFVEHLRALHCQFALDDFGTGLNPFQLLKAIPADYLKIDHSLMEDIATSDENQDAIRTITDTAHSMNKMVVAQFVEDAGALTVLWGIGVNYIQGNFLQPPSHAMDYDFTSLS